MRSNKLIANWILGDAMAYANSQNLPLWKTHIEPGHIADLVDLIEWEVISGKSAKEVFEHLCTNDKELTISEIVHKYDLYKVDDDNLIEQAIDRVISENPEKVIAVKAKPAMLGWFVGQTMKIVGKSDPKIVNEALKVKLGI